MDIKKIKELIKILKDTDITEFELVENEESVKITKQVPTTSVSAWAEPTVASAVTQPPVPQPAAAAAPVIPEPVIEEPSLGRTINSPMVGTFYTSPNPDAEPFARVGQKIRIGDPVCIVEAMKMFNKIESEIEGTIKQILVEDGEPVEFDQPLFEIE
ncbi:MAG: acetyl-CoA carboxylase, biotin carboxyl carrier protein [Gammaproteobacteria bacterium]|nr:MAG: acetyl-CoA carboxylase, biotin carboxyl carrier protein [Gammaproteobacteria bacterium]